MSEKRDRPSFNRKNKRATASLCRAPAPAHTPQGKASAGHRRAGSWVTPAPPPRLPEDKGKPRCRRSGNQHTFLVYSQDFPFPERSLLSCTVTSDTFKHISMLTTTGTRTRLYQRKFNTSSRKRCRQDVRPRRKAVAWRACTSAHRCSSLDRAQACDGSAP